MNERIFHLTGTESIDELKELISWCNASTVVFLFPKKSWLFQQKTDLVALRDFADEKQKEVVVVTQNAIARTEIQAMGMSVFSSLEDREKTPFEKMKLSAGENYSCKKISSIPLETLKNAIQKKAKSCDEEKTIELKNKISRPVLHSLILLGVFLFVFFLFVLQVAIPDAVIEISPFKKEEEMHINVNMLSKSEYKESDLWRENNGVFAYPVEQVYEVSKTFSHVTQEFQGKNAEGEMKITNTLDEELVFRGGTRMETPDGITFVLKSWVKIPPARRGKPGIKIVHVVASERDKYEKLQGDRANIPKNQKFIFPGLSVKNQTKIFAENTTAMTGGETKWIYKMTKDDIEKAVSQLIKEVRKQKKDELEFALHSQFPTEKNMEFLPFEGGQFESEILEISFENKIYGRKGKDGWEKIMKTFEETQEEDIIVNAETGEKASHVEKIESAYDLIGEERTEFSGKIRVRVKNYAYSRDDLFALISEKFKRSAPKGMELLLVDKRVLHPEILGVYANNTRIKVSFSTRGIYQYIIEPKSKQGLEFSRRLKSEVLGMDREKAKVYLINNFPEISDVKISLWPLWVKKIPSLPEKITLHQVNVSVLNAEENSELSPE